MGVVRGSRGPSRRCVCLDTEERDEERGKTRFIVLKGSGEDILPVLIDTRLGGDSGLPRQVRVTGRAEQSTASRCLVRWDLLMEGWVLLELAGGQKRRSPGWQSGFGGQMF